MRNEVGSFALISFTGVLLCGKMCVPQRALHTTARFTKLAILHMEWLFESRFLFFVPDTFTVYMYNFNALVR